MIWTLFGPMSACLQMPTFALCLVLQGLRVCQRASLEGSQHLGMPYLFPSLPFLCLGLLLLFSVINGTGGCLAISSNEAAESCSCSCCNFILMSDGPWDRNLSFKNHLFLEKA